MGQYDDAISRAIARRQGAPATPAAPAPEDPLMQRVLSHVGTDATAEQVPAQRPANPRQAESDYLTAARENYGLKRPGPEASQLATHAAAAIRDKPADIEATPSLGEEALIAIQPLQIRGDKRPDSVAKTPAWVMQHAVHQAVSNTLDVVDPLWLHPELNAIRDATLPEDEKGIPTENHILWALRVAGTAVPAVAQESIERIPVPGVTAAAKAAMHGEFAKAATSFFTPSTVNQELFGYAPGDLQRVRRDTTVTDWAEGVLERIEEGRGLEEEFSRSAAIRLGPEHPHLQDAAWWLGLGVDTLTDWEGALVKGSRLATETLRKTSELGKLAPDMNLSARVWSAVSGNYLDGDWLGEKIAKFLEDGGSIDDVPAAIRARMEQVSLEKLEQPLVELAETTGVGAPRTIQATDLGYAERLSEAEKAAQAGKVPGVFADRRAVTERPDLAEAAAKRPPLPEFRNQPTDAVSWYNEAAKLYAKGEHPPGGYNWRRQEGFNRLRGSEEMTPDRFTYVVRNAKGDVIRQTDFAGGIESILKRQLDGDSLWDAEKRPVARWATTGKPRLTSDYLFASPVERRIVEGLRSVGGDARAWPARLRQLKAAADARRAERMAGGLIADATTGAPAGAKPLTEMGQVAVDATRLALRDMMGSAELKQLGNGAMVAAGDKARILKGVVERVGVGQERAAKIIGGALPTAEEEAKLAGLAARAGIPREPGTLTSKLYTQLRHAAMGEEGGVLADIRYRVQGTRAFLDRMWAAVSDAHLDRRKWGKITETFATHGPIAWVSKRFLEDKFGTLPLVPRSMWKETSTRLGRVADDLQLEFKALPKDMSPAQRMQTLIGRYTAVHPDELARAQTMMDQAARDQLRMEWKGPRPSWLDQEDPVRFQWGFRTWSRGVTDAAEDAGRQWVSSNLIAAGQDMSQTVLKDLVHTAVPRDLAVEIYREAFERGDLVGPGLQEAMRLLNRDMKPLNTTAALVTHALSLKAEAIVAEEMDKLLGSGAVVLGNDLRRRALDAAVMGKHKSWNEAAKRWEFRFPEAQVTWASQKLLDWGIEEGSGAALKDLSLGRRSVTVPKYIADDLARMVSSAQLDSRKVYDTELLNTVLRAFKEWTTHGLIMPNPAFFTGQMLSLAPTMITTRGLKGTAEAAGTFIRHPLIVGSLVKRLAGGGSPTFASRVAESDLLRLADGGLASIDDLEHGARLGGLQDTQTSFETAESLKDVLARDGADYGVLDPRRLRMPTAWWQNKIREVAGSFDLTARMSVFVSEVERGVPMDVAAQAAREAALDFRNLTEWEAKYMRQVFTFYAFMRKNSDAYVKALAHNPARVLGQMRLAHASAVGQGLTPIEQGAVSDDDLARMTVYDDDEVVNDKGRIHPLYRMNRLQTTPMGVAEVLGTIRSMAGLFDGNGKQFAQNITPIGQTLAILAMGRKLDRDYDAPLNNRVPPILMDSFLGPVLQSTFAVGPVALRETDDPETRDEDATNELGSRKPAVWAAGGDRSLTPEQQAAARDRWQAFLTWFSRPLGTLQQFSEAAGGIPVLRDLGLFEPPPPNLTQSEATTAALLGLRYKPALKESEAVRRAETAREYRFRDAQDAIALPGSKRAR